MKLKYAKKYIPEEYHYILEDYETNLEKIELEFLNYKKRNKRYFILMMFFSFFLAFYMKLLNFGDNMTSILEYILGSIGFTIILFFIFFIMFRLEYIENKNIFDFEEDFIIKALNLDKNYNGTKLIKEFISKKLIKDIFSDNYITFINNKKYSIKNDYYYLKVPILENNKFNIIVNYLNGNIIVNYLDGNIKIDYNIFGIIAKVEIKKDIFDIGDESILINKQNIDTISIKNNYFIKVLKEFIKGGNYYLLIEKNAIFIKKLGDSDFNKFSILKEVFFLKIIPRQSFLNIKIILNEYKKIENLFYKLTD